MVSEKRDKEASGPTFKWSSGALVQLLIESIDVVFKLPEIDTKALKGRTVGQWRWELVADRVANGTTPAMLLDQPPPTALKCMDKWERMKRAVIAFVW
jgi:hypothetical protein